MKRLLVSTLGMFLALSQSAFATEADIGPLKIKSVGVIGSATDQHLPGNMEIEIPAGLVPKQLQCSDKIHITTKSVNDPDRAMLSLLRDAKNTGKFVSLRVSDDPALTAYPGRCSLKVVGIY